MILVFESSMSPVATAPPLPPEAVGSLAETSPEAPVVEMPLPPDAGTPGVEDAEAIVAMARGRK